MGTKKNPVDDERSCKHGRAWSQSCWLCREEKRTADPEQQIERLTRPRPWKPQPPG